MSRQLALSLLAVACSCGTNGSSGDPAIFPTDYAATYREVRNCRRSLEHAANVRILVSPDAFDAYNGRAVAFPVSSFVLKEEYEVNDVSCARPIIRYTVMQKLAAQTSPQDLDWEWQETGADFHATKKDIATCISCHTVCGKPPQGYDATCSEP